MCASVISNEQKVSVPLMDVSQIRAWRRVEGAVSDFDSSFTLYFFFLNSEYYISLL